MLSNELSVLELCATKNYFCSTDQSTVCENLRLFAKKDKKSYAFLRQKFLQILNRVFLEHTSNPDTDSCTKM